MKQETKELIFRYLAYFLILSFFGWLFETLAVYFTTGKLTDRGYFFIGPRLNTSFLTFPIFKVFNQHIIWGLPAIEMYGIGGLLCIMLVKQYKHSFILVFIFGTLYLTLFELLGSYWCEFILKHSYWNYHKEFLNFQGRICLQSSIAWGVLSLFLIYYIEPFIEGFYVKIKNDKYTHKIIIFLTLYMLVCASIKYIFFPQIINN